MTEEAPGNYRLFKYLDITYQLPSDTTVRNVLAKIYIELHGKVIRKLSVSFTVKKSTELVLTTPLTECQVENILHQR